MPKAFNITLVHPHTYPHSLALKEAADYLHAALTACGYPSVRTTNQLMTRAHNVIFCAHMLPASQIEKVPADSIIFNSEQLEDSTGWQFRGGTYQSALSRLCVWDYSHSNLARISHDNKSVIPFLYCPELRRPDIRRQPGSALLFYGSVTPRRRRILEALQLAGVPVDVVFGEYAEQRDARMLRSWAVLNLHKADDTEAFEPIRCFYPLINHVPVISEDASDASIEAFRDSVHFFEPAALLPGVAELYGHRVAFDARSEEMFEAFSRKSPLPAVAAAAEVFLRRWG